MPTTQPSITCMAGSSRKPVDSTTASFSGAAVPPKIEVNTL